MNTIIDIKKLTDAELLEFLCSCDDDQLLYNEFVNRFLKSVQKECEQICKKRKLDSHIGKQIAHETFENIRKYKSFKKDEIKIANHRNAILAYLYRISSNLFINYHNNQKKSVTIHRTYFDDILDSVENTKIDAKVLQNKKDLAVFIFNKLNPKEKRIILTDIEYKRHHKYLPDDIVDLLANELNIKRDTVRKIRERAIVKIKNAIDEINNR